MERTFEQLEDVFRKAVVKILQLPRNRRSTVRFPYGSTAEMGDAPSFSRTDKVCFIYLLPTEDGYGGLTETSYRDDGNDLLTRVEKRTNVWQVNFACYGSTAYEWTQQLRSGLLWPDVRGALLQTGLSIVPDSMTISRVPEVRDGEWWTRFDLNTTFYEAVCLTRNNSIGIIENVRITSATEKGSG